MQCKELAALKSKLGRRVCLFRSLGLQFVKARTGARKAIAFGASADVGERSLEQDFFHCGADVVPDVFQAARVRIGTHEAAFGVGLNAGRIDDTVVRDTKHFANGNFGWIAREQITAVDSATAGDEATAT